MWLNGKNLPAQQETWVRALGQGDPGEGDGNALQYSCLEKIPSRGAWKVRVHRVAQNQT